MFSLLVEDNDWKQVTTWRNNVTNRVDSTVTTVALSGAPALMTKVAMTYDPDGRPRAVMRSQSPDPAGIGVLLDSTYYDDLGRAVKMVASDGAVDSTGYDDADNPILLIPRRIKEFSGPITLQYDPLNRLRQRVLPSVAYAVNVSGIAGFNGYAEPAYPRYLGAGSTQTTFGNKTGTDTIPGETQTFVYDSTGLRQANGRDATVARRYNPNGSLAADSVRVRATLDSTFPVSHTYVTTYAYDLDGRRTGVTYPAQISPGGVARAVSFGYDDGATGMLATVSDMLGSTVGLTYDKVGQLITLDHNYN